MNSTEFNTIIWKAECVGWDTAEVRKITFSPSHIPLSPYLFVEKTLNAIFDYRFKALEDLFKDDKTKIRKSA